MPQRIFLGLLQILKDRACCYYCQRKMGTAVAFQRGYCEGVEQSLSRHIQLKELIIELCCRRREP